jgi:endonuclease/exonuclease/phosphatase (EEP) superfamily protein YafD
MPFARLVVTAILGPPVLAGALICALAAALAQLGRRSVGWDVLTHAAPVYLAGGFLALAAALVFHDRTRALALIFGAAAAVAALLLMAPEYLRSAGPRARADAPGALKLVQFNAWGGQGGDGRIIEWIAAQHPDVVIMEESSRSLRDGIQARTGLVLADGQSNVAIFSRLPTAGLQQPLVDLDGPMMLNAATFQTAAGPATVLGVHYPWPTERDRLAGVPRLEQAIRGFPADTTILAGDFNSTPWSFARQREDHAFGLIRRTRALFSWPAAFHMPFPLLPIDHVYAGPAWATVSVERGPKLGSDHYPVVVMLAPAAAAKGAPQRP